MADEPDFSEITIRNPDGPGGERQVAKWTFEAGHWPGWERVDSKGRTISTASKES